MAKCLSNDMGWTHLCSEAWVHSVVCARKQCGAIATLSIITNRMGNFDVDPNAITAATCNEAQVGHHCSRLLVQTCCSPPFAS